MWDGRMVWPVDCYFDASYVPVIETFSLLSYIVWWLYVLLFDISQTSHLLELSARLVIRKSAFSPISHSLVIGLVMCWSGLSIRPISKYRDSSSSPFLDFARFHPPG